MYTRMHSGYLTYVLLRSTCYIEVTTKLGYIEFRGILRGLLVVCVLGGGRGGGGGVNNDIYDPVVRIVSVINDPWC